MTNTITSQNTDFPSETPCLYLSKTEEENISVLWTYRIYASESNDNNEILFQLIYCREGKDSFVSFNQPQIHHTVPAVTIAGNLLCLQLYTVGSGICSRF